LELSPKLLRQCILWLVIGIALYGITVIISGADNIRTLLAQIGWGGWALLLGLSTLNIAIRFGRWHYYLLTLSHRVPMLRNLEYFLAGFAFTSTPAKAGEAVRSLYLKRDAVGYTDSLAALFVERLTDLVAVILLALAAAYSFANYRWLVVLAGIITCSLLPLIHSQTLREKLALLNRRMPQGTVRKGVDHLLNLLRSSAALLRSGPLYGGMLLSMCAAFAVSLMMYVVLLLLGADISLPLAVGIYATGILAGALSFLPGGIGSAEAVMIALLILTGIDVSTATAATLACRIAALWYSIGIGIVIVLLLELKPARARRVIE
jgi:glycosyltransferase 2 family protein